MLSEMRKCGFCLGFWIAVIAYILFLNSGGILDFIERNILIGILDCIITSMVSSWLIQYFIMGWKQENTIQYVK